MTELYIGLMSGTSVDAIDAALVDFSSKNWRLVSTYSHPIPPQLKQSILDLCLPNGDEIDPMGTMDRELGYFFSEATLELVKRSPYSAKDICAIGSHGQTIRHRPDLDRAFTLQIGDPFTIAAKTGIDTVADFRRRDIAEGGQGAPLTPGFHLALLKYNKIDTPTCIVNIGGMANVTVIHKDDRVIGFDTGPGNALMDGWIQQQLGKPYDNNGKWAASGKINSRLLDELLRHPFLQKQPPKSTGREDFNLPWLHTLLAKQPGTAAQDVQATLAEFTVCTIAKHIAQYPDAKGVYACGGGTHSNHLLTRLRQLLPNNYIQTTAALGIDPDWIEAAAFAWLAMCHIHRKPGNLPSVTGAKKSVSLGAFFPSR
ncbi:MAG: anhydro-N-acetylmuramic acid kinase [Cellvibrionaceae bacterium]|nr:anhydro-N-acetylmuramic acid kinase [Cellvibrionaceae bacterium]